MSNNLQRSTLAKLTLSGTDYMDTLLKEVPFESIPSCLGGGFQQYNERYEFDLSDGGALFFEGSQMTSTQLLDLTLYEETPVVLTDATEESPSVSLMADRGAVDSANISGPEECDSPSHLGLWEDFWFTIKSEVLSAVAERPCFSLLFAVSLYCCVARHGQWQLLSVFLPGVVLVVTYVCCHVLFF
jgi:hypothetical protein